MRPKLLVFVGTTICIVIVLAWTFGQHLTYYGYDIFYKEDTPLLEQTLKYEQITKASHMTTSTVQTFQPVQLDSLRKQRRDHLLKACEDDDVKYHGTYQVPYTVQERMQVSQKHRLLYCGLEKAASSFMKRIFMILNGAEKKSPYDMPTSLAGFGVLNLSDFKPAIVPDMLQNSTIVIISRDPYTRLLSAYIDKIFSPNAMFADKIGKFALLLTRKEPSEQSLRCGFDLTFKEFIKYFIQSETTGLNRDNHFAPAYQMCLPCTYDYNYIAKTDTLLNDTVYLLNQLGEKKLAVNLQMNFTNKNRQDKINDQPNLLFMFRDKYKGCLSFFDAQRRIWKKMQATGVIDKKSKYPVSREESENITRSSFERLLMAAVSDVNDVTVARQQREEAAIEAYSTIDKDDMENLYKIFAPDCKIFNFNCRPSKFFETDPKIKSWYFDLETA